MRKVLLVLVILLIGGVIAADRIGVRVAQDEIAKQIAAQQDLPRKPTVTIHGFPFLTQAVGGQYDQIDVNIGDWTQQNVTVRDLKIEISGLKAPLGDIIKRDTSHLAARTATASAIIPYDVLKERAPRGVKDIAAEGKDLKLKGTFTFLGLNTDVTMVVSVKATPQGIAITPDSVQSGVVSIPISLLRQRLTFTVPVKNLPIGSRISKIEVTPNGLRVAATADDVTFRELQ
jgi:LmeA-like phospholipid-binding